MTKDILEARIKELIMMLNESGENFQRLKNQLEHATNTHNALVGRFEEAKELLKKLEQSDVEKPIETYVGE